MHDHVLLALVLECRDRGIHSRIRREFPKPVAVRLVECRQSAVCPAHEQQAAGGHDGSAEADLTPLLTPYETVRRYIQSSEDAGISDLRLTEGAAHIHLVRRRILELLACREIADAIGRADVEQMRLGIVGARRPVGASHGAGLGHHRLRPERSEDPSVVRQLGSPGCQACTIRNEVDLLRHDAVAHGIRLGGRGRLLRLLRHGPLLDADERLAALTIQNVGPAGLRDLGEALAEPAVDRRVEQHDRIGRVIVPDVVMHLLEMPAVLAGLRLQGNDGDGI